MGKRKVKTVGRKLRPSNADRYLSCPASVVAAQDLPVSEGTTYSNDGNVVHELADLCLQQGKKPEDFIGQPICAHQGLNIYVKPEHIENAKVYLKWIEEQGFTEYESEAELEFPWIKNPDGELTTGKADLVGYDADFRKLVVADYKNGFQPVPDDSYQFGMYSYPLLMSGKYDVDEVIAARVQPNVDPSRSTPIGQHVWTKRDMEQLRAKIEKTTKWVAETKYEDLKDSDYCEGHWCKFCPLSSGKAGEKMCPKKLDEMFGGSSAKDTLAVAEDKLPAPSRMTDEQVALILSKRSDIKKWLDDVYKFKVQQAEAGVEVPGMKLVHGKAKPRAWKSDLDDHEIIEGLIQLAGLPREKCFKEQEIITPATVKKLIKGKQLDPIEDLLKPPEKGVELVPADDNRNATDNSDLF